MSEPSNWSRATPVQLEAMLVCRCGAVNTPSLTTVRLEGSHATCDLCGYHAPVYKFIPYPKELRQR